MDIPKHLSHSPIIGVDYSEKDADAGDAKYLSIGYSTWDSNDFSVKIWRKSGNSWSRQSEELPLWRVLDLAELVIATLTGQISSLGEEIVNTNKVDDLKAFLQENMQLYISRIHNLKKLLDYSNTESSNEDYPNIFSFATKELSQDALIAWLLAWGDDSYKTKDSELHLLGKQVISLFADIPVENIHTVEVGRQWENIDIWAEINDDTFLAIEDKTGTSIHDDQLKRYKQTVEEFYRGKRQNLNFAYFKTENEPLSVLKEVRKNGYKDIDRLQILDILNNYSGSNAIVVSYRDHLMAIEHKTQNFLAYPVHNWDWYAWQGFYKEIEKHIDIESWGYVANPSGGFLGLWWHFCDNDEISMYLQFEESKLCVKIYYEGDEEKSEIRDKYYNILMDNVKNASFELTKPDRFGHGTYMTIGVVREKDVFGDGIIDVPKIVLMLKELEKIVDKCVC